jgi:small subunit ribosomal protein S3Ae
MAAGKGMESWKAKKWFNIQAPEILGSNTIGEMPATEDKDTLGRMIKVNMSWITNNPSHSFIVLGLKVIDVNGNSAHTQLKYLEQTYSYTHSLVRRYASTIYTIDKAKDKDNKNVVLKLIVTTTRRITTQKRKALRKELAAFAKEYISSRDSAQFIKDVMDGNLQKEAMAKVHKIASINRLEVKKVELL